ncbi:unnamed protein product [Caenorhabditis angaria]|uniref:DUF38 domain-containing protein n=1 Tax=Caenorhabditis angaria TaxID=860376 RepID=A0A9P1IB15_9PELO|nr:unnamed protein product [Caenorhabditis angaria]
MSKIFVFFLVLPFLVFSGPDPTKIEAQKLVNQMLKSFETKNKTIISQHIDKDVVINFCNVAKFEYDMVVILLDLGMTIDPIKLKVLSAKYENPKLLKGHGSTKLLLRDMTLDFYLKKIENRWKLNLLDFKTC